MLMSDGTPVFVRMCKKDAIADDGKQVWVLSVQIDWMQHSLTFSCPKRLFQASYTPVNMPSGLSSHTNTTIFLSSVCFMPAPYENHQTATSGGTARSVTTATASASLH